MKKPTHPLFILLLLVTGFILPALALPFTPGDALTLKGRVHCPVLTYDACPSPTAIALRRNLTRFTSHAQCPNPLFLATSFSQSPGDWARNISLRWGNTPDLENGTLLSLEPSGQWASPHKAPLGPIPALLSRGITLIPDTQAFAPHKVPFSRPMLTMPPGVTVLIPETSDS